MMGVGRRGARRNDLIAPGTALVFALLTLWLQPLYERTFGTAMPGFTRAFLDFYPLWIGVSSAALAATAAGSQLPIAKRWPGLWRFLDAVLAIAVVLIVAGGVIALFLPLLLRPMPA